MTLDKWCNELLRKVSEFRDNWETSHQLSIDAYPMEMLPGDWDEQFSFWCEANKNREHNAN